MKTRRPVNSDVRWLSIMHITQGKWLEKQCRIEDGIFFANDDVILLRGNPENGYEASDPLSLTSLIKEDADGWTHIDPLAPCRAENEGILVVGGSTACEGEGFVATLDRLSGTLLWLIHLSQSEAFVEVNFDGESILAVSSEYPDTYRWQIPVSNPSALVVISERAI